MNLVTSMILRRMRKPFIILITVYSISILGLSLIPGVDDQGNPWKMSFFHAFYYVSFTATTIGFGEIPYALNDAQRLWVISTIYFTVISWLYAIGKILTLVQDETFRQAVTRSRFKNSVNNLHEPFYLVCGLGETGHEVVSALTDEHYRAVVIEKNKNNMNELKLNELREYVPFIIGDASDPAQLELAGIKHRLCKGVIAVTSDDQTNLKIAITSKLLHPNIKVASRSELKDYEENMLSFDTDHVVNPYETFAETFAMLIHSPSLHLIFDWLTGASNTRLTEPLYFRYGHWILCGYGRFGKQLYEKLIEHDIKTTVIEPDPEVVKEFKQQYAEQADDIIQGTGIDAKTLNKANVKDSAGIIAGSDNDSNNLSIIMTARAINSDLFVVARQNIYTNSALYTATKSNLVMRPREIIARMFRALFLNPLLVDYLDLALKESEKDIEWPNIVISRLSAVLGEMKPHIWTVTIDTEQAPAIIKGLEFGRNINLGHLTQDPSSRTRKLQCVPLLYCKANEKIPMPEDEIKVEAGDTIMFCGSRDVMKSMFWTLKVMSSLNYVMTFKNEPESYIWRLLYRHFFRVERRNTPRKKHG